MKGSLLGKRRASWPAAGFAALAGMFMLSTSAHAEYVAMQTPFDQGMPLQSLLEGSAGGSSLQTTQLVWGTSLAMNTLSLPGTGVLSVRLDDIKFTDTLDSLSLLVTDLDDVWQRLDGAGSLLVDVNGPTKLFAMVFARSPSSGIGLYNLQASFSPVPLPAAGWLLLSGLGVLTAARRRSALRAIA